MSNRILMIVESVLSLQWKLVLLLFCLGLSIRFVGLIGPHQEGDERIYMHLVMQLESGNGYTLQGSSLLAGGTIDRQQYDHPLFFHPPGGIFLDWLFYRLFGPWGMAIVQLFSYTLFFWSMMLLSVSLGLATSNVALSLVAGLSAFNPLMAHVTLRFWLDGPLLAFTTLAAALFLRAVSRNSRSGALIAGILMGYASLIKLTAFLVIPGLLLLAWFKFSSNRPTAKKSTKRARQRAGTVRGTIKLFLTMTAAAVIVQLPWEIWQWLALGSPFPGWAGKPSASLIAGNAYVAYVTLSRSPWVYLTLTPRILCTLVPSLLMYAVFWKNDRIGWPGFSLIFWIGCVLSAHVAAGYLGYSKVLRYVILVVPASILLFALLFDQAVRTAENSETAPHRRRLIGVLLAVSVVAALLEMGTGIYATFTSNNFLVFPLLGPHY